MTANAKSLAQVDDLSDKSVGDYVDELSKGLSKNLMCSN